MYEAWKYIRNRRITKKIKIMYELYSENRVILCETLDQVVEELEKIVCSSCLPDKEGGYCDEGEIDLSRYRTITAIEKIDALRSTHCGCEVELCKEIEQELDK